ncbi:hypothetical protein OG948_58055 (plasmid) [Embleya sp. NBC_00888]|uniref:hypothetical protein n=1 Tax=Embleya sp. NBC_00888 TaxID=2975960 RepID=UPI002F9089F3|nr:hypothetical protein OG948_58055 [Embleya sp. NBC_00888]
MTTARTGRNQLTGWIDRVKVTGPPELVSFVNRIVSDLRAVEAELSLPFGSGAVEVG